MAFSFFMKRKEKNQPKIAPLAIANQEEVDNSKPLIPVPIFKKKQAYAFIDASNLFWGGKENMGFKVDYRKLLTYIEKKYGVVKAFYYGGVRIFDFEYSILDGKPLDLEKLKQHLTDLRDKSAEKEQLLIDRSIKKISFYQLLESYGYIMKIKPAKVFYDEDDENEERPILKANCDVDMSFDIMRYMQQYSAIVGMTGDGDFAPIFSYLKSHDRSVTIFSRWSRTAKEIREVAGDNFVDFDKLRNTVRY